MHKLSPAEARGAILALRLLAGMTPASIRDLSLTWGVSDSTTSKRAARLIETGVLARNGRGFEAGPRALTLSRKWRLTTESND